MSNLPISHRDSTVILCLLKCQIAFIGVFTSTQDCKFLGEIAVEEWEKGYWGKNDIANERVDHLRKCSSETI